MSIRQAINHLRQHRLIPVIRAHSADDAIWGATQLIEAGFGVMEITYGTPKAELVIEMLANDYPHVLVGAGTVTEQTQADKVIQAGAKFLASPVLREALQEYVTDQDILLLPGVLTPSEMFQARDWGAKLIKVFPAEAIGGPSYLKSVLAPLPELQLVPTGGIHLENFTDYLAVGVVAVGLGSHLAPPDLLAHRDKNNIHHRARAYQEKLAIWRQETETPASEAGHPA